MCGIAGFLVGAERSEDSGLRHVVQRMIEKLHHRGPDDRGVWVDASQGVALGHARLSIQDLSPLGHQPMVSASGRFVVAFNGELYNFRELRRDLEDKGYPFRGHSDTEVLLAAVESWSVEAALRRFVGMFAFALWDTHERSLILARDRLGEKPLYYGWQRGTFLFGSELKALRAHPSWVGMVNRSALALYMRHNYVPAPYSIHEEIFKLPPGTFLKIRSSVSPGTLPEPIAYWSAAEVARRGMESPFQGTASEAIERLEELLLDSLAGKMVSDVPLGAFLSGGYDSSLVVALMQKLAGHPVKTFSIGFNEDGYNEAHHAAAVARHLGTDHTELYVTPGEAMAVIPELPEIYDEPFSDSSQIPTFLVSRLAREQVTVSLSGDGGDELFGGYTRYSQGREMLGAMHKLPGSLRRVLARMIHTISPRNWDRIFLLLQPFLPARLRVSLPGNKLYKLATLLERHGERTLYRALVSHWDDPISLVNGAKELPTALTDPANEIPVEDFTDYMMYVDLVSYLPDDILVKVDRAAMAVSLETRVPLLDHRLVEFAWTLPRDLKIRGGQSKWILRQVLYRHVPQQLMDRPKMGFGVPIDHWLRGPLKEWAEDLLDEARLREGGWFDPGPIRTKWEEHVSEKNNWAYHIWDVLMFEAWRERIHG